MFRNFRQLLTLAVVCVGLSGLTSSAVANQSETLVFGPDLGTIISNEDGSVPTIWAFQPGPYAGAPWYDPWYGGYWYQVTPVYWFTWDVDGDGSDDDADDIDFYFAYVPGGLAGGQVENVTSWGWTKTEFASFSSLITWTSSAYGADQSLPPYQWQQVTEPATGGFFDIIDITLSTALPGMDFSIANIQEPWWYYY